VCRMFYRQEHSGTSSQSCNIAACGTANVASCSRDVWSNLGQEIGYIEAFVAFLSPSTTCAGVVPQIRPLSLPHTQFTVHYCLIDSLCGLLVRGPEVRFRFPALPDFMRSSGSVTGSTQPREYN
jgi:hypothetical protein